MARKRRRKAKARRRSVVVINRPRHHTRRRHRRSNPMLSVRGILPRLWTGAIDGGIIVATEAGTRLIRKRVLNMTAGSLLSGAAELAISTTAGILAGHFINQHVGQTIIDGGFASVIRATVKQSQAPWVADALSDDGRRNFTVTRDGRVVRGSRMSGYVPGVTPAAPARLNGYVPGTPAARPTLGSYVPGYAPGQGAAEMAAAFAMTD